MTFRKIVVGHDLKEGGEDALALGAELARATGADLLVTKVFPLEMVPYRDTDKWREREVEELRRLLLESEVAGAEPDVYASSSRGRGLYELAEEVGADLVVIGSSSRGTVERAVVGDVAMVLLHGAPCAVAVAPRGYRERSGPIRRITVGYDASPESRHALAETWELAGAAGAAVSIASVPPAATGPRWHAIRQAIEDRTHDQLEQARGTAPRGVTVDVELLDGDPAAALVSAAGQSDLLAVGSRGYGPVKRVLLGSVSAELLHSSSTPVLVFPRADDAGRHETTIDEAVPTEV